MAASYKWQAITETATFAPRDGAGAVTLHDAMFLLGGWNPDPDMAHIFPRVCNSEVWRSVDGVDWQLVAERAPWEGRHCAGYVVHEGKIFIVGGDCNQGHCECRFSDHVCCASASRSSLISSDGRGHQIKLMFGAALMELDGTVYATLCPGVPASTHAQCTRPCRLTVSYMC